VAIIAAVTAALSAYTIRREEGAPPSAGKVEVAEDVEGAAQLLFVDVSRCDSCKLDAPLLQYLSVLVVARACAFRGGMRGDGGRGCSAGGC
jgi:hypothetical protein